MKKIFLSLIVITSLSSASWIGALKSDKKRGYVALSAGQAILDNDTDILSSLEFGGNNYYNNGVVLGATFGLGYTENSFEMNGRFKLGYSFGEITKGLTLYGLSDFSYLIYNELNSQLEDTTNFAQGIGFGAEIEYCFNNKWLLSTSYTTINMTPDSGKDFDYNKALISIGHRF